MGSSMVSALSERMDVKIYRDGYIHHDGYERGVPVVDLVDGLLPTIGRTKETGTEINFLPDGEILKKPDLRQSGLRAVTRLGLLKSGPYIKL